jgi:hypothetical protein
MPVLSSQDAPRCSACQCLPSWARSEWVDAHAKAKKGRGASWGFCARLNSSRVRSPKRPLPSATLVAAPLNSVPSLLEASCAPLLLLLLGPSPLLLLGLLLLLASGWPAARRAREPSCAEDTCREICHTATQWSIIREGHLGRAVHLKIDAGVVPRSSCASWGGQASSLHAERGSPGAVCQSRCVRQYRLQRTCTGHMPALGRRAGGSRSAAPVQPGA